MAVAAKPEVEIWRRPKKWTFDPGFLFTPSDSFWLGRTISPQYKTSQTDRQTIYCTKGSTDSTVGQKSFRGYKSRLKSRFSLNREFKPIRNNYFESPAYKTDAGHRISLVSLARSETSTPGNIRCGSVELMAVFSCRDRGGHTVWTIGLEECLLLSQLSITLLLAIRQHLSLSLSECVPVCLSVCLSSYRQFYSPLTIICCNINLMLLHGLLGACLGLV